jgi:HAE1 family hydrophobic/amphiphilic exporter-1
MLALAPVVLGVVSFARLGVDLFPSFDYPLVSVTTTLPGASAEEIESSVTKPIEDALQRIGGMEGIHSMSREGVSSVLIDFRLEKDPDKAAQEVRDKVGQVLLTLPPSTLPPIVDVFDLGATPVVSLVVSGPRSEREISELASRRIGPSLEGIPGVGRVALAGARLRAIQVEVDARKLEAYGLSIDQVREALLAANVELPGGRLTQGSREVVVRTLGRLGDPRDFEDVIVTSARGHPVRVRDIACVLDSIEEPRTVARYDGASAVTLSVQKRSGANTLEVIRSVRERLHELERALPRDVKLAVVRDQSDFIGGSLHELEKHLVLGTLLVGLTILLFLNDWRTMLIAFVSIPTSIVSTFAAMKALGFTVNNVTLLALVLAVGIVIDDAVVVHENIYRWMEEKGLSAWQAARAATEEITLAVVATTFSLVVIFVPVAFMEGVIGRFFQSFGITLLVSILLSLGVGLTLTPMLCARFLKLTRRAEVARAQGHAGTSTSPLAWLYEKPYLACLRFSLERRWVVALASLLVVASTPFLYAVVEKDFVPKDDQSEFEVVVAAPQSWSLERVSEEVGRVEAKVRELPAVEHVLTTIGDTRGRSAKGEGDVTHAIVYARLAPHERRVHGLLERAIGRGPGISQFEVMRRAREMLRGFPDLRTQVRVPPVTDFDVAGADVSCDLMGPDLGELERTSDAILARLKATPGIRDADSTLTERSPELRVRVLRTRAMGLGVPVRTVAATLQTLVGGEVVTGWRDEATGESCDVWLRASPRDRTDPSTIERLAVPSPTAGLVRLSNLAVLEPARGPATIGRIDRQRSVTLTCNVDGIAVGTAVEAIQRIASEVGLPPGTSIDFTGNAKVLDETTRGFALAFALSFAFMYMILAAQFESFAHPVAILAALPLTIPFALVSLLALGQPLDIYSFFGLFLLFGIVKKNGILVVDTTNQLRARGVSRDAAIVEANRTRLRPILMTTLMLMAGMVPIALGTGPGARSRASIAMVILGGQGLSLVLSLLVTPVVYSYLDDFRNWAGRLVPEPEPEPEPGATGPQVTKAPEPDPMRETVPS